MRPSPPARARRAAPSASTARPERGPAFEAALGAARRAVTSAAASLDRTVVRWTQQQIAQRREQQRAAPASGAGQDARIRIAEIARAYSVETAGVPSRFFPVPEVAPLQLTALGQGPQGSRIWDLAQPSSYQPFWSGARESYLTHRENLTSHARWWSAPRSRDAGRSVLIAIHGWKAGAYWMSERVFEVSYWLHHGFDVVAFQLPFHGRRTPEASSGKRSSGAMFPSNNLARTNEAFGHAVHDLRALIAALRQHHGATTVGALGMSLGGYTTALTASVCDELDFAIAMIPAVSMPQLMLRSSEGVGRRAREAGVDEQLLHDAFAVHSPLARPARLPAQRLFVIAGDGDRITPADQAQALIDHWGCESHWFAGGHLAQVGRHQALRAARLHLRAGGICGE